MNIDWKNSYCIGETLIDLQHQALFELANAVDPDVMRDWTKMQRKYHAH